MAGQKYSRMKEWKDRRMAGQKYSRMKECYDGRMVLPIKKYHRSTKNILYMYCSTGNSALHGKLPKRP